MREKSRLTYFEVVLIVVILGVFAGTIGPRFTEADTEAEVSRLIDGLEMMRAHLDLYRAQHEDCLPPSDSFASFQAAMTTMMGQCGPYVKEIPTNPFNRLNTVRFDGEPAGAGEAGWRLDTKTGLFQADNSAVHSAL
jgi:type II secretory pathway pseudopilin PulG